MRKKTTLSRTFNQISYAITSLFKAARIGDVDIVLTTTPPALISITGWLIAKVKKAKLIYDVRDIWPDVAWEMGVLTPNSLMSRVFEGIRDFMIKHSDLVLTVSPGKVEKLRMYGSESKVVLITNGLDASFLENQYKPEIADRYLLANGFNCVYIGNIGWAQGLMQLLTLAERAKIEGLNSRFVIFGSGVEETQLKKYVADRQLNNVIFAGKIPNNDIYTVLCSAQVCFVSLVNEKLTDSVPTKLFEALGVGCPVLLSAAGDSVKILEESCLGIAVLPNNPDELWKAFVELYYNIDQVKEKKEFAQAYILENYSRAKAAEHLESVLRKL